MNLRQRMAAAVVSVVFGSAAWAGDIALVLSNTDYEYLPDVPQSHSLNQLGMSLRQQGFEVLEDRGLDAVGLRRMASRFENILADSPDRVVVVLAGHFVGSGDQVWMLGEQARFPELITAGAQGLSVNAVAGILSAAQGRALLILSSPQSKLHVGQGMATGWNGLTAPQGITLAQSDVGAVRDVVERFMEPGRSFAEAASDVPDGVQVTGFLPTSQAFTPEPSSPLQSPAYVAELAYWEAVRDIGTIEAVDAYLNRYPRGQFAGVARAMKNDILNDSLRQAQNAELALNLTQEQRMEIQRQLTLLGYDPRGIDGVFGRGTRAAIMGWQGRNGIEDTGYLDRIQLRLLRQQAQVVADRLEREAQRRQAEMERQDRSYWNETGRGQSEQGLRAYLRRYPDGLFSDAARDRLRQIQEARRQNAARVERMAWDQAAQLDTLDGYEAFLARFPNSQFSDAARDRIAELQNEERNRQLLEQAKAEERVVTRSQVTRILVERRLVQLGLLKQNQADGNFNAKTRRAIRQFQRSRDLPVTGYVSQMTLVNILALLVERPDK